MPALVTHKRNAVNQISIGKSPFSIDIWIENIAFYVKLNFNYKNLNISLPTLKHLTPIEWIHSLLY